MIEPRSTDTYARRLTSLQSSEISLTDQKKTNPKFKEIQQQFKTVNNRYYAQSPVTYEHLHTQNKNLSRVILKAENSKSR